MSIKNVHVHSLLYCFKKKKNSFKKHFYIQIKEEVWTTMLWFRAK